MIDTATNTEGKAIAACCDDRGATPAGGACCAPVAEKRAADKAADDERVRVAEIKSMVRSYYAERAVTGSACCGEGCGCGSDADFDAIASAVGYSEEELEGSPEGANLGLGCGNPTAIDAIPEGATVLDLGSGAGMDCFLAARKVGPAGRVIGVDMTPEMIARARENAAKAGFENVSFRLGEIEDLPVDDASVDVVISNCVINLSPDKPRVFREAFRVLKPGGKLMVSDLVLTGELPDSVRRSVEAYAGCIAGAEPRYRYLAQIEAAGFRRIQEAGVSDYLAALGQESLPVISLKVYAEKPLD
ncbi:MAG TPA: arsenite methyltransferase [Rhodothermales bacterium]